MGSCTEQNRLKVQGALIRSWTWSAWQTAADWFRAPFGGEVFNSWSSIKMICARGATWKVSRSEKVLTLAAMLR